ncbi:MAG: autotransporter outer membrane beta-barrel domain-containing protein [Bacteroidales bacterium]|nr:autotransporter outer membrane beta-barrel domain-containing protein [Bacteroidales bacterium]
MKNTQIIASLILVLAVCFSAAAQTENTTNVPKRKLNSRIAVGFDVPILVDNSEFSDFMSNQFQMEAPSALFGSTLSVGWNFSKSKRWFWDISIGVRSSNRSKDNITRNWTQAYFPLRFSYAILDNNSFRLSPFAGINYRVNQLYYCDMRSIGNLNQITEILETSFTSFNLAQWSVGCEFGLQFDFKVDDPSTRLNPQFSAFVKWEQSFHNSNWHLEKFEIRDIPKFQNNALTIGILIGI